MHRIKSYYRKPLKLYDHIKNKEGSKNALVIDMGNEFNGFAKLNLELLDDNVVTRALPLACLNRSDFGPSLMSKEIRAMVKDNNLAAIIMGYPYISLKIRNLLAIKAKEQGKKWFFQGHTINKHASELDKFGCFDGIPCTRFNEAGSSKRAMVDLGLDGSKVEDLTEEERALLNMKAACDIGHEFFKFVQARRGNSL